jgi:hypothetical protein
MPVIEKTADTVAKARAATVVATVTTTVMRHGYG